MNRAATATAAAAGATTGARAAWSCTSTSVLQSPLLARSGDILIEVTISVLGFKVGRKVDLTNASLIRSELQLALWLATDFGSHGKRRCCGCVSFWHVERRLCWEFDDLAAELCRARGASMYSWGRGLVLVIGQIRLGLSLATRLLLGPSCLAPSCTTGLLCLLHGRCMKHGC